MRRENEPAPPLDGPGAAGSKPPAGPAGRERRGPSRAPAAGAHRTDPSSTDRLRAPASALSWRSHMRCMSLLAISNTSPGSYSGAIEGADDARFVTGPPSGVPGTTSSWPPSAQSAVPFQMLPISA